MTENDVKADVSVDEPKTKVKVAKKVVAKAVKKVAKPSKVKPTPKTKPVKEPKQVDPIPLDAVPPGKTAYDAIREEVEKPTAKREQIQTRRGNLKTPRRYHLTAAKMQKLMEKNIDGNFPNPYRKGGIYHALVQSLANLGVNEKHRFDIVIVEVQNVLGTFTTKDKLNAWDAFAGRTPRNQLSGKDVRGRILQNAMVLQRLTGFHLYGEKLRQLCSCVDIFQDKDGLPLLRLNTKFDVAKDVAPINDLRSPKNRGRRKKIVPIVENIQPVTSTETVVEIPVPVAVEIPVVTEMQDMPEVIESVESIVSTETLIE